MDISKELHIMGTTDCLDELESAYENIISSIRMLYEEGVFLSEESMNTIVDRANILANYNIARIAETMFSSYKDGALEQDRIQSGLVRCINSLKNSNENDTENYLIRTLFKESITN